MNIMKRIVVVLSLLLSVVCASRLSAQSNKARVVSATYVYEMPDNVTKVEAYRIAEEQARLKALADEFGTVVSGNTAMLVKNRDNGTTDGGMSMSTYAATDVKGEWLGDISEPQIKESYRNGHLIITATVKGRARRIVQATANFTAALLRNGIEDKFKSDRFVAGDDIYLSFRSAETGYLAVYMVDDAMQTYCLLPFGSEESGIVPVCADYRYVFFSQQVYQNTLRKDPNQKYYTQCPFELQVTCVSEMEQNVFYVLFSPNKFVKAIDTVNPESGLSELPFADFQKWLVKMRNFDPQMQVQKIDIQVTRQ